MDFAFLKYYSARMTIFDKYLNIPTLAFSILSTMLSVCTSAGYVIITITSIYGLILAIAMALSNLIVASIILYTTINLNNYNDKIVTKHSSFHNKIINIAFTILAFLILLGGISAQITSYQGVLLLATALALTIPTSYIIGIALFVGAVAFFGYILYASKIAIDLYSRLQNPLNISGNISSDNNNFNIKLPAEIIEHESILTIECKKYRLFHVPNPKENSQHYTSTAIRRPRCNSL